MSFEIAILEYLLGGGMKQTIHVNHEVVNVDVDLTSDGCVDAVDFVGKSVPKEVEYLVLKGKTGIFRLI